jgi:predicted aspartyl protease
MAADVCSTPPGRLFIIDRVSNLRFLVDTGFDLCVFPRRLIPGRRERTSYDLFTANGTPIPTYRWYTLTLNLGLRRNFTWRFVVADVHIPIIGVDLLANFSLLVDCRNDRILDGITSLSAPAQPASTRFPSVKTIGSSTPTDDLFAEFPDLTRPSGVQRTVRHNTVHHIKTTPGPPVSCRPRRLIPDRLAIAKAEFDAMLRDGMARCSDGS